MQRMVLPLGQFAGLIAWLSFLDISGVQSAFESFGTLVSRG